MSAGALTMAEQGIILFVVAFLCIASVAGLAVGIFMGCGGEWTCSQWFCCILGRVCLRRVCCSGAARALMRKLKEEEEADPESSP